VVIAFAVVLAAALFYAKFHWESGTRSLRDRLEAARVSTEPRVFTGGELEGLPASVQRYFREVLREGYPIVAAVTVQHQGTFNMSQTSEQWKPFTSAQRVVPPQRWSGGCVSSILAFFCAWIALAYHRTFFSSVNPLAYAFAGLSLVGAGFFLWQGVVRRQLEFKATAGVRTPVGLGLSVFALGVYPVWSYSQGTAIQPYLHLAFRASSRYSPLACSHFWSRNRRL